ncbi:MAG: D-alanyl-D-alanine endopeptidase [Betaproteobacteria bacterium]|nr:D-alanyl-D-alanine endopeptidase [Casimicrobiaceae bacterium]
MKRSLIIVFLALLAAPAWGQFAAPDPSRLRLSSANVLVLDAAADRQIYAKAADEVTPIASVTKLMTAMVVLDAQQSLDETLDIDMGDFDFLKGSHSRLRMGSALSRREMLRLALMSSENRAASSLARHYPGGTRAFVDAMNFKAASLGMSHTHYSDPTGLSADNVSTAKDLAKLVQAAADYALIREFTTTPSYMVEVPSTGQTLGFNNSNALIKSQEWDIRLQKTGYIREAGKCVVMLVNIASKPFVIVLLDSIGKYTRIADAQRVKHWLETGESLVIAAPRASMRAVKAKAVKRGTFEPRIIKTSSRRR